MSKIISCWILEGWWSQGELVFYRNVILILYEPIDQARGGEKRVRSDATVIGDDPLVELV